MREARKLGLTVVEKNESLDRLVEADEIFLSSSLKLVLGISEIAHRRRRYLFAPGEITHTLAGRMRRLARI
jgi:branched-subunit amino acid aminotransferase/4-amino-4-deoxychorismate lyase